MQFLPDGPDIPDDLVTLQERGQTIFVCGAGVSRTIGLPLFLGLVQGIYQELGEDWNFYPAEREGMRQGGRLEGQYDRVLRCLERRLAASDLPRRRGMRERIRAAVRNVLAPPENPDPTNHLALLDLSPRLRGPKAAPYHELRHDVRARVVRSTARPHRQSRGRGNAAAEGLGL